jgi:hypothetical protein
MLAGSVGAWTVSAAACSNSQLVSSKMPRARNRGRGRFPGDRSLPQMSPEKRAARGHEGLDPPDRHAVKVNGQIKPAIRPGAGADLTAASRPRFSR